jgi:hypothetical protein
MVLDGVEYTIETFCPVFYSKEMPNQPNFFMMALIARGKQFGVTCCASGIRMWLPINTA